MLNESRIEIEDGAAAIELFSAQDWKHLHGKLKSLAQQRVALEAAEADLLLEAEESHLYLRLGYPTMHDYMEHELHYGRHAASERLRVAHELIDLPLIAEAFRAGELPFSVVREVTRPATDDNEEEWLDAIRGKTAAQVQQMVKGRRKGDVPGDRPDPALIKERIVLEVSPAVYAVWRQTLVALDDESGKHLSEDELALTMCRRSMEPVVTTDRPTKPSYQISVTTCRECKRGFQVGPGFEVELTAAALDRACCDAEHIGDLEDDTPTRVKPTIPASIRRKLFVRDKFACTHPGCRARRYLEAHHILHREHGGGHQMWNLTVLCFAHHQRLHDGAITMRGRAPDQLVFESRAKAEWEE